MEKHQLSSMIAGISLLAAIILVIVPSVYAGNDEESSKDLCKANGGDWEDGSCDFETDDEDKADNYINDMQKIEKFEEERAADEDALCDDPEDTKKFDICQSATLAFASKDEDYSETEEWNEKDYKETIERQEAEEEKAADEDALCDDPDSKADVCNSNDDDDDDNDNKYINKDEDSDLYTFKSQRGDNEVTSYFKDKDDAEKAYNDLDRDELTHQDKSYSDWEYYDEEHPALK